MFSKMGLSKKVRECYLEALELDPGNLEARGSVARRRCPAGISIAASSASGTT